LFGDSGYACKKYHTSNAQRFFFGRLMGTWPNTEKNWLVKQNPKADVVVVIAIVVVVVIHYVLKQLAYCFTSMKQI